MSIDENRTETSSLIHIEKELEKEYQVDDFCSTVNKSYSLALQSLLDNDNSDEFLKALTGMTSATSRFVFGGAKDSGGYTQDLDYHLELEFWDLLAKLKKTKSDAFVYTESKYDGDCNIYSAENRKLDADYIEKLINEQVPTTFHQFEVLILRKDIRLIRAKHYLEFLQKVYKRSAHKGLIHFHGLPNEPVHNFAWYHIRCGDVKSAMRELESKAQHHILPHLMLEDNNAKDTNEISDDDHINRGSYMLRTWKFCEKLSESANGNDKDEARVLASICGNFDVLMKCEDKTISLKCSVDSNSIAYRLWCRLKCEYICIVNQLFVKYLKECRQRYGENFPNCKDSEIEDMERWIKKMNDSNQKAHNEYFKSHKQQNSVMDHDFFGEFLNMDLFYKLEDEKFASSGKSDDSNKFISWACEKAFNCSSGSKLFQPFCDVSDPKENYSYLKDSAIEKHKVNAKKSRIDAHLLIWLSLQNEKEKNAEFFFRSSYAGKSNFDSQDSFSVKKDVLEEAVATHIGFLCKSRQWRYAMPYFNFISLGRKVNLITKILCELADHILVKKKGEVDTEISETYSAISDHIKESAISDHIKGSAISDHIKDLEFREFLDTIFFNRVVNNTSLTDFNFQCCFLNDYRIYSDPNSISSHSVLTPHEFSRRPDLQMESVFVLIGWENKTMGGRSRYESHKFNGEEVIRKIRYRCCRLVQSWLNPKRNEPKLDFKLICRHILKLNEKLKARCDPYQGHDLFDYWVNYANFVLGLAPWSDNIVVDLCDIRGYLQTYTSDRLERLFMSHNKDETLEFKKVRHIFKEDLFPKIVASIKGSLVKVKGLDEECLAHINRILDDADFQEIAERPAESNIKKFAFERDKLVKYTLIVFEIQSLLDVLLTFDCVLKVAIPHILDEYTISQIKLNSEAGYVNITNLASLVAENLHKYCNREQKVKFLRIVSHSLLELTSIAPEKYGF